MTGTVTYFNNEKGYGFIRGDDGKDVFVHVHNILGFCGIYGTYPKAGQRATYSVRDSAKGKMAVNVSVEPPTA